MDEASRYLADLSSLLVGVGGGYFQLVEGVENAADNFYFESAKETGAGELSVSMGILARGQKFFWSVVCLYFGRV